MILIRRAVPEDCAQLWQVHTQAIRQSTRTHYTPEEVQAWAGFLSVEGYRPNIAANLFLVAQESQSLLGFAELDRSTGSIEAVYVAPTFLRRGIGTQLLQALETHARKGGLTRLDVLSSLNAVPFYTGAGYKTIGKATHAIPGSPIVLRCVHMEKLL